MSEQRTSPPTLSGMRVLLVEDNDDNRDLFAFVLGRAGAAITALASAEDALAAFEREIPDVVVSDTGLEGQSGWAMIGTIRRIEALYGVRVPAIAVSGDAHLGDVARSLSSGFDVHLSKPVDMDQLIATIERLTRQVGHPGAPVKDGVSPAFGTKGAQLRDLSPRLQTRSPTAHREAHRIARPAENPKRAADVGEHDFTIE